MAKFMTSSVALNLKSRARSVRTKFIFGDSLGNNEVGRLIYVDFLPSALSGGRSVAAPDPLVGKGLNHIQAGFDAQRKGMSAKKVVVSL